MAGLSPLGQDRQEILNANGTITVNVTGTERWSADARNGATYPFTVNEEVNAAIAVGQHERGYPVVVTQGGIYDGEGMLHRACGIVEHEVTSEVVATERVHATVGPEAVVSLVVAVDQLDDGGDGWA